MTDSALEQRRVDAAARSRGLIASACLAVVCMLVLLWWAAHYEAVVESLGEWQFATFGRYFPSLTVALAVALVSVPVASFVAWQRRRRIALAAREGLVSPRDRVLVAVNGALRGRIFFLAVAAFAALWAIGAALTLLSLPGAQGTVATVTGAEGAAVVEGPARFAPGRTLGRVGRLEEWAGVVRRVTYVAPVRPVSARTGPVRFFTEVERLAGPQPRFVPIREGILEARGLPGELVNLYRGDGVETVDRPFLLVRDADWLRWRPLVLGGQLALLALLALVAALMLQRQARRLDRFLASGVPQA